MKIISHRGFWHSSSEKNELVAFDRALSHGFGIETDIRDCGSNLVISHDFPKGIELGFENFLDLYCSKTKDLIEKPWLALNIKADGMAIDMLSSLKKFNINEYFVFDMSFPEMLSYSKSHANIFSRVSEYESHNTFLEFSNGFWLDCFDTDWYPLEFIDNLLKFKNHVCIVSPELHSRDPANIWNILKEISNRDGLYICTDHPLQFSNLIFS